MERIRQKRTTIRVECTVGFRELFEAINPDALAVFSFDSGSSSRRELDSDTTITICDLNGVEKLKGTVGEKLKVLAEASIIEINPRELK